MTTAHAGAATSANTPSVSLPEVERVLATLRRDVARPLDLPELTPKGLRWRSGKKLLCLLGLHPLAKSECPHIWAALPLDELDGPEIRATGVWWDSLTSPVEAVNLVWGKR